MRKHFPSQALVMALAIGLTFVSPANAAKSSTSPLDSAIQGKQRSPDHKEFDKWQHPKQTLVFFGVKPDQKVIEIWPGDGRNTEILAPYLKESGKLISAVEPADTPERIKRRSDFVNKLADDPDSYGEATIVTFDPAKSDIRPVGGVDVVLSNLNTNQWIKDGTVDAALKAFYRALKSGGTLGIVDYRAEPGTPLEESIRTGYVTESYLIERAKAAGFEFSKRSEINAKKSKAAANGSPSADADRLTLRFVKPASAPLPDDVIRSVRADDASQTTAR